MRLSLKSLLFVCAALSVLFSCTDKEKKSADVVRAPYGTYSEGLISDVTPTGWIEEFLSRQRSGLTGHPDAMDYPYNTCLWAGEIPRNTPDYGSSWWRYEQTAYYSDGILRLGYLLDDSTMVSKAVAGIEYTLSNADSLGRLGLHDLHQGEDDIMVWPMAVYFRVMQAYYQASGDSRIPAALEKNYLSYNAEDLSSWRNVISIEGILWTYSLTGNRSLLSLAEDIWKIGNFEVNEKACLSEEPLDVHGVTFCESVKIPMLLYAYTGKDEYLQAALSAETTMEKFDMLPDGVPSSAENLAGQDVTHSHETCDVSDFTWSMGYYLMTTGESRWADRIERAVFNAGPGAITKDFKALQYFSSVNQFIATGNSNNNSFAHGSTWMAYRSTHQTECCAGNVHRFMPNYVARMWLLGEEDNIVSAMYGPSTVSVELSDKSVCTLEQKTSYPFDDVINYIFSFDRGGRHRLRFSFRIPEWARGVNLRMNGKVIPYRADDKGFGHVEAKFRTGDELTLTFDVEVELVKAEDDQGYYVQRGPILYSYPIDAEVSVDDTEYPNMHGKVSRETGFRNWSMVPVGEWNYGISASTEPEFIWKGMSGYPFDPQNVPSVVRVPVRKIDWALKENRYTPENPRGPVVPVSEIEYVDLVPYGSTTLRLTVLPSVL